MDHTVKNKHFPGVFEATPLRAPVRPWGHAPRQANPVLTQGRRGAQGRDTPPIIYLLFSLYCTTHRFALFKIQPYYRYGLEAGNKGVNGPRALQL